MRSGFAADDGLISRAIKRRAFSQESLRPKIFHALTNAPILGR